MENAQPSDSPLTLSERLNPTEAFNVSERAFKGRYGTRLYSVKLENGDTEQRLLIPDAYKTLLEFGGVITAGTDTNLLLFSSQHWQRTVESLSKQVGFDPDRNSLVRHVYGRHVEFAGLNEDGSITLNDDLVGYAGLKDEVVLVGLIYYAEVHAAQHYFDQLLTPEQISQLASALK